MDIANFDQISTEFTSTIVPFWWSMYQKCLSEGFNENQALAILLKYIEATTKV